MGIKRYLDKNVYDSAVERLNIVFDEFEKVYLSFSGGKDSGVLLNLALKIAKEKNKLPLNVLYIDLEAQYKHTIDYIHDMITNNDIKCHWVCLPMSTPNAVSMFEPIWITWDESKKDKWVREKPTNYPVISDPAFFPFYKQDMEFEEFVPKYAEWFSEGKKTCCLVGIRADESLNRFRTIARDDKGTYNNHKWTTKVAENVYNAYPIYDWQTDDIWIANAKFGWSYNKIYDLMYQAGLSIHQMRICEPYGPDQRRGLWLYHIIEPETWKKVSERVSGANFGSIYANEKILGNFKVELPENHTWQSYAMFLLETMPPPTAEHYKNKIAIYLKWFKDRDFPNGIPDYQIGDTGSKDIPSWRRICKTLLRNDYWCRTLTFSQTKASSYERYKEMMKKRREKWEII